MNQLKLFDRIGSSVRFDQRLGSTASKRIVFRCKCQRSEIGVGGFIPITDFAKRLGCKGLNPQLCSHIARCGGHQKAFDLIVDSRKITLPIVVLEPLLFDGPGVFDLLCGGQSWRILSERIVSPLEGFDRFLGLIALVVDPRDSQLQID